MYLWRYLIYRTLWRRNLHRSFRRWAQPVTVHRRHEVFGVWLMLLFMPGWLVIVFLKIALPRVANAARWTYYWISKQVHDRRR